MAYRLPNDRLMITYRRPNDHLIRHASYLSLSNLDFLVLPSTKQLHLGLERCLNGLHRQSGRDHEGRRIHDALLRSAEHERGGHSGAVSAENGNVSDLNRFDSPFVWDLIQTHTDRFRPISAPNHSEHILTIRF